MDVLDQLIEHLKGMQSKKLKNKMETFGKPKGIAIEKVEVKKLPEDGEEMPEEMGLMGEEKEESPEVEKSEDLPHEMGEGEELSDEELKQMIEKYLSKG